MLRPHSQVLGDLHRDDQRQRRVHLHAHTELASAFERLSAPHAPPRHVRGFPAVPTPITGMQRAVTPRLREATRAERELLFRELDLDAATKRERAGVRA